MTIPKLTPYTGQVANPDGSQTQTEFTQNMFDQLSYEATLATELDATIDGMNQAVTDVESSANSASASATSAEASASTTGYQGLWPDTGGSANKGDTYQTQVGGTPTGEYYTALQDTSVNPVGDNVNWKVAGTIGQQNLSNYTDIVYKASGGNSAVENMVAGHPVSVKVGDLCSTGGILWKRVTQSSPSVISDFVSITQINVKDFGAVGDGVTDDSDAIQAAINASKSIEVPPGNYLLSKSLEFSISNFEVRGTKGESVFVVDGNYAALTIPTEFTAENCRVSGINFDTTTNGVGKGIYCVSPAVYLAHWTIRDCTFSTHLNYGIDANMIGCEVVSTMFGYHDRNAVGFQAIRSRGSQTTPIRVSNINKFDSCEFARCDNMPYVVEFDIGIRIEFTNCVFEVNKPTLSVVRLNGVHKPVFQGCWFEVNDADSLVSLGLKDGIDALALSFTDGIINETGTTITAAFDFTNTQNRTLIFENTLISQGSFDLTKHNTGTVTVLSQKGNYSTNSQISMGPYDKVFFGTGVSTTDLQANTVEVSGNFQVKDQSTSTTQYSETYQMVGSNSYVVTTDLAIPYANTNAGGIAVIRGSLSNGRSFSVVYAVSIRIGSGNDVDAAVIGNSGVYAPNFTFANVGGFLTVSNDDAAGTSYMTLIGF